MGWLFSNKRAILLNVLISLYSRISRLSQRSLPLSLELYEINLARLFLQLFRITEEHLLHQIRQVFVVTNSAYCNHRAISKTSFFSFQIKWTYIAMKRLYKQSRSCVSDSPYCNLITSEFAGKNRQKVPMLTTVKAMNPFLINFPHQRFSCNWYRRLKVYRCLQSRWYFTALYKKRMLW